MQKRPNILPPRIAKCQMWRLSLILFLTVNILVLLPLQADARRKEKCKQKVRLRDCSSGIYTRADEDTLHLGCYQEEQPIYTNSGPIFSCSDVRSLEEFTVNNVQYIVVTETKKGIVNVSRWDADIATFVGVQSLYVQHAYSAKIIPVSVGELLLVVAVFDGQACPRCNSDSPVYQWEHAAKRFTRRPIQRLPVTRFIQWFPERYHNHTTSIVVIGRCRCPTSLYYWDEHTQHLREITESFADNRLHSWDVLIETLRFQNKQLILSASLYKPTSRNVTMVRVYEWSQDGTVTNRGELDTHVRDRKGFSAIGYKDSAFICAVFNRKRTAIYKLLRTNNGTYSLKVMFQIKSTVTLCNLFLHSISRELYVAIGIPSVTKLLRYNPIAGKFSIVEELGSNSNALVNFRSRDDDFMVTAQSGGSCSIYKRN